jgi:cellulase
MPSTSSKTLLAALAGAATVIAHGHVNDIIVNGVFWQGYDPTQMPYMSNPPTVVGWTTEQRDNGFIAPDAFASADMICHRDAKNAGGHAVVAAGDKVFIQWSTWPEGHHGPVIDYLANCGDAGCETVDKTSLKFFKIDEVGLVDGSVSPGTWGSDQLIANNNSWLVEIPPTIAPGFYVLRHEIIALHSANNADGAQAYPQCFNLQVTGGGSDAPEGTAGTALYGANDPGILINIYYPPLSTYIVPGPALYTGAVSIAQAASVATATSTAETGSAVVAAPTNAGTTTAAANTPANSNGGVVAPTTTASPAATQASTVTAAPVKPTSAECDAPRTRTVTVRAHARDIRGL